MRVLLFEDVIVRDQVLLVQRFVECRKHLTRIDERLQFSLFNQPTLVSLPAIAVNQVRIKWAVFVRVFQIQGA